MNNYGKTKDDFIKFFIDELYSKTHFEYEHDPEVMGFFDPDDPYNDHIVAAQEHVKQYIQASIQDSGENLSSDEIALLYEKKKEEVFSILLPEIDRYIENKVIINVVWPDSMRLILNKNGEFRFLGSQKEVPKLADKENDEIIDIDHEEE